MFTTFDFCIVASCDSFANVICLVSSTPCLGERENNIRTLFRMYKRGAYALADKMSKPFSYKISELDFITRGVPTGELRTSVIRYCLLFTLTLSHTPVVAGVESTFPWPPRRKAGTCT